MKLFVHRPRAFSLVEVTLALGVAAFCLLAVFGLLPVGLQTNRNATAQTDATNIIAFVVADLRANFKGPSTIPAWYSPLLCVPLGTQTTLYFDSQGRCSSNLAGTINPCGGGFSQTQAVQTRYQLNITFFPLSTGNLTYADLKVTWPAAVNPATNTPSGSVEMFAAFNRK
jgi:type II secretory pathway pseudopilin PulG